MGRKEPTQPAKATRALKVSSNLDLSGTRKKRSSVKARSKLGQNGRLTGVGKDSDNKRPRGTRRERKHPTKPNVADPPVLNASRTFDLALRKQEQDRLDRDSATQRHLKWAVFFVVLLQGYGPPHASGIALRILNFFAKTWGQ